MHVIRNLLFVLFLTSLLSACGGSDKVEEQAPTIDNTQEVLDYYAARPDFFSFKTIADLPTNLIWESGIDLPELGSEQATKGGTEYYQIQDFPRTLRRVGPDANGSFRSWIGDYTALGLAHRHLDKFEFFPALAESWALDPENKTVYVKLNPDAQWSDGVPITTDDMLFMFFFYQSDYIVAPWYKNWYGTQYTKITKYDDLTFAISMPQFKPDGGAGILDLAPVPQHFYKELGDDFVDRYQWRFQPTTGPYIVKTEDIVKGSSIILTRLDNWWAKDNKFFKNRYNVDRIQLNVIRDTAKAFEAFKKGDIDQARLNLAELWYDKLPDSDPDVQNGYIHKSVFYNQRPRPTYALWMNASKPLLENLNVRLGIQHATNWQVVIERYFRGDYTRMQTSSDGYGEFSHPTLKAREYDIDKALEYFTKAGFTERDANGILVNSQGQKLAFTLSTGYVEMQDILTILKEEALKAGLEFRVEVLDGTSGFKKIQEKQHDIHFVALNVGLEMAPRFWETYHSDNAYDDAFLEDGSVNPERKLKTQTNNMEAMAHFEMDDLIDRYRASSDKEEMKELAFKMTEIHHDYASFVPGFYQAFFRIGHWRWLRYPENFNHKHASMARQYHLHWLDLEMRDETIAAQKAGKTFEPVIKVYDQFR